MSQVSDPPLIPPADPPLRDEVGAERSRFLLTVRGYVRGQVLADYAAVLDTVIRWSLGRPDPPISIHPIRPTTQLGA